MAASLQHVMSPRLTNRWPLLLFPLVLSAEPAPARDGDAWTRYHRIRDRQIFADVHAHPSRFHRDDVERVGERELSIYRREGFGVVVCSVSSDAAFQADTPTGTAARCRGWAATTPTTSLPARPSTSPWTG